jgi:hypothetical protein
MKSTEHSYGQQKFFEFFMFILGLASRMDSGTSNTCWLSVAWLAPFGSRTERSVRCGCILASHTNAILSRDKTHMSTHNTYSKNRLRGGNTIALHNTLLHRQKLIYIFIYNNSHYALCPQRILKPNGPFPKHCKNYLLQPQNYLQIENIRSFAH